jgi:hypothetical protein
VVASKSSFYHLSLINIITFKEQNAKDSQAAKKAKKAEAAVIEETPEETAAFLAKVKGQSQPLKTVSNFTQAFYS